MPEKKASFVLPSDELILAAIERAVRHSRRCDDSAVLFRTVVEHLGLQHSSWTTRRVRPQLVRLKSDGLVDTTRRHGLILWGLTPKGRRRFARLSRSGAMPALPEAPQHRIWRQSQQKAAERIDEFRSALRVELDRSIVLLEQPRLASSDAWYDLASGLCDACKRVGSAVYCLSEWAEPDDAIADVVPPDLAARRNTYLW